MSTGGTPDLSPVPDETCAAFSHESLTALPEDTLHRFVVGEDTAPRLLNTEEIQSELGDAFARLLLLQGVFPRTAQEVVTALNEATSAEDPLGQPQFFLVGEGSQLASTPSLAIPRNLHFLATSRSGPNGPDIMISSFGPDSPRVAVEVMAWDDEHAGFNYYRTIGNDNATWAFAGNSRHALMEATEFKGPFESHPSGNMVMKELRFPWVHWHSPAAPVTPSDFADEEPLVDHSWFDNLDPFGAYTLELEAAIPSIRRWTAARFEALIRAKTIERPERIMQQVLDTPTVNLITSKTESAAAAQTDTVDLPQTFFVDSQTLTETLGLEQPPPLKVRSDLYLTSLDQFEFHLTDGQGFSRAGDTHFAFIVPERAFEDVELVRVAIERGLLTERFAACLLMTDFANPVFSARRAKLVEHTPATASLRDGKSSFSQDMADAILAAAEAAGESSPEAEFRSHWQAGNRWREQFNQMLAAYYEAVTGRLTTQEGFDDYCRLAESRRNRVRQLPIFESPLLFPATNILGGERSMNPDGTITGD